MRILPYFTLIHTLLICGILMALVASMIWAGSRWGHSKNRTWLMITLAMFFVGFCSLLMNVTLLDLPIDEVFKIITRVSLVLGCAFACFGALSLIWDWWYRGHRPNQKPLNYKSIFHAHKEIIIIADYEGQIIEVNHMSQLIALLNLEKKIGSIHEIMSLLKIKQDQGEIGIITCAITKNNLRLGTVMTLQDYSALNQIEQKLQEQNIEIEQANVQLEEQMHTLAHLAAEQHRLQLLETLQGSLIYQIENAVTSIEYIQGQVQNSDFDLEQTQVHLKQVATELRTTYKSVRNSIHDIAGRGRHD